MKAILEGMGYGVLIANDGLEAIEVAQRERPDAILMDMCLPMMDGFETTLRLRQLPELRGIKVIACSAENYWEWRAKAIAAGCDAFMAKPVNFIELQSILAR